MESKHFRIKIKDSGFLKLILWKKKCNVISGKLHNYLYLFVYVFVRNVLLLCQADKTTTIFH